MPLIRNRKLWYSLYLISIFIVIYIISVCIKDLSQKLGAISIVVAFISIILFFMSDTLVNTILNTDFRRIIGQIEDLRLELSEIHSVIDFTTGNTTTGPKITTYNQINTWKCQTYTDDAIDIILKSDIKPNSVSRFLNLINNYFSVILIVRNQLSLEAVINFFSIYKRIYDLENSLSRRDLESYNYETRRDASIPIIRNLTGIGANVNIDYEFLIQYEAIIQTFINQADTIQQREDRRWNMPFSRMRNIFNSQYQSL